MYTTYENYINRHVTIHRAECKQIAKRGGMHKDSRARYVGHKTYRDAELYAKGTRLPIWVCSFCNSHDRGS